MIRIEAVNQQNAPGRIEVLVVDAVAMANEPKTTIGSRNGDGEQELEAVARSIRQ